MPVTRGETLALQRSLQQQAAAAEQDLKKPGVEASANRQVSEAIAIINGADLANQSPRAGEDFGSQYAKAVAKGLRFGSMAVAVHRFRPGATGAGDRGSLEI